jgi:hypothetical protein
MKLMIKTFDQLWKRERASFPSRHDFTPQIYHFRSLLAHDLILSFVRGLGAHNDDASLE